MARKLSVKQKKYLDKLMKADPNFKSGYDLTNEQESVLNEMSLFEDLIGCVNRYVGDKRTEENLNRNW